MLHSIKIKKRINNTISQETGSVKGVDRYPGRSILNHKITEKLIHFYCEHIIFAIV